MADSIGKKLKGLFMSNKNKNKKKKADTGSANDSTGSAGTDAGFGVLDDAQAPDADENTGALAGLGAPEEETLTEAPTASDGILENVEDEAPEPALKAEKTHQKVARIAAEMNTKGYGL